MSENLKSGVEYRRDFPDQLLDGFSASDSVMLVGGNVDGEVYVDDKPTYIGDLLLKRAVQRGNHKLVIYYDAATKNASFADEHLKLSTGKSPMTETFSKLGITLAADGDSGDFLPKLFDPSFSKPHDDARADLAFFTVLEKLSREHTGITFCVVINNGHLIFPDQSHTHAGAGHAPFQARLKGIAKDLKGSSNRNVVVLDNANRVSGDLSAMVSKVDVPSSTSAEMRDILGRVIEDPKQLVKAIQFAVTVAVTKVMELVEKSGQDADFLISELLKLRTENIVKMSGELLSADSGFSTGEVALSPAVRHFCQTLARNFIERPKLVDHGVLLMGPPGTGKSVFPAYVASLLGIPFLKLDSLSTSGLAGISLDKANKIFDTLEANKPCILFIDEIDKLLPSSSDRLRSSNDDQVIGFIQNKLADDKVMQGILLFGATNEPDRLDAPMLRSGRFGTKIAVLPPKTVEEKMAVFKAVWNQLSKSGGFNVDGQKVFMCDDEALKMILFDLPDHITGGVMKQMLVDAFNRVNGENSANIWDAFILLKSRVRKGEYMKKEARFDDAVAKAWEFNNFDFDEENQKSPELSENELLTLAFVRLHAQLAESQKKAEDRLAKSAEALQKERERIEATKADCDVLVGAALEAANLKDAEAERKIEQIKAEEARIEAMIEIAKKEHQAVTDHMEAQRQVLEDLVKSRSSELFEVELKYMSSCHDYLDGLAKTNIDNLNEADFNSILGEINEFLSKITAMRSTVFGVLNKTELNNIEAAFTEYFVKYSDKFEAMKLKRGKGASGSGNQKSFSPGKSRPTRPPNLPEIRNSTESSHIQSTIRRILRTTAGRVALTIGIWVGTGAIYYVAVTRKESVESAEQIQQNPTIMFDSEKEAAEKEAARVATEKAAAEKAVKKAAEKAAAEKAVKEAAEKVAAEKAVKEAAEKAATEKKNTEFLQKWNLFQGNSKILAAFRTLGTESNKGLDVPGLDNMFLFKGDNEAYTIRITCNYLEPVIYDLLRNSSFHGITTNATDENITFGLKIGQGMSESVRELIYLLEEFVQAKRNASHYFNISTNPPSVTPYAKNYLDNLSFNSFGRIFPSDEYKILLSNNLFLTRDLLAFERILQGASKSLNRLEKSIGYAEMRKVFSKINSVTELEVFLGNFNKVEERYTVIDNKRIDLTQSIVADIARELTKLYSGNTTEPTPCAGTALVIIEEHNISYENYDKYTKIYGTKTCYPLSMNESGELIIGDFSMKTSTRSYEVEEKWGEWEKKDPYYKQNDVDEAATSISKLLKEKCSNDSFIASCSLKKVSDSTYRVVADGAKSTEILFKYILQNLNSQDSTYRVIEIGPDNMTMGLSVGKATVVCKINILSNVAIRTDVISVNRQPIKGELSSEPVWMSTVRRKIKTDLEELINKRLNSIFDTRPKKGQ